MIAPLFQTLIMLCLGISIILLFSIRLKVHPFFALLTAAFVVGLGVGMPVNEVISTLKEGFGNILKSLGLIVVLGTSLGVLLERNGSTQVMADYILKKIGPKYPALAMSITGFIVGLPIFCDSGFIVLSGLNQSLAQRTGSKVAVLAFSMATGLYAVHCLIPPHPGAAAAALTIGVDYGKLILLGILAAIPAMFVAYFYIQYASKKIDDNPIAAHPVVEAINGKRPSVIKAILPVIIPILLIAARSFLITDPKSLTWWQQVLSAIGDPVIALIIGTLLALLGARFLTQKAITQSLQESVEKAGSILVIIAGGGAFGAILAATKIGQQFSETLPLGNLGILFPFLLTSLLKTAQGSSTVAIITAASIIQPLLEPLGFHTPDDKLLCVLAMGAGSMMVSHANDAYFWVISRFENIELASMLRVYSVATFLMGLITFLVVCLMGLFI